VFKKKGSIRKYIRGEGRKLHKLMKKFMLRSLHQYCYSADHLKENGKDGI
jgi:hypothetical protein